MQCLVLDITANCLCEIRCKALDGFDLKTVHKLSSKEKKILTDLGFKPGAAVREARMQPPRQRDLADSGLFGVAAAAAADTCRK